MGSETLEVVSRVVADSRGLVGWARAVKAKKGRRRRLVKSIIEVMENG